MKKLLSNLVIIFTTVTLLSACGENATTNATENASCNSTCNATENATEVVKDTAQSNR